MSKYVKSICTHLSRPSYFFVIALSILLGGCSSSTKVSSQIDSKNEQSSGAPSPWPILKDEAASSYLQTCESDYILAEAKFIKLESVAPETSTQSILDDVNQLDIILDRMIGSASLMNHVHPSPEYREAADICEQKFMSLYTDITLSRSFYDTIAGLKTDTLSKLDKHYVDKILEGFERSGVSQDEKTRKKIKILNDELLLIAQEFDRNIRDDVRSLEARPEQLQGLPKDFIASHPVNSNGKVVINTDYPDYYPVMGYAEDDDLRKQLYLLDKTRAYPANKIVLKKMLDKRYELAQLLGFKNFAEYAIAIQMIGTPAKAKDFIEKINIAAMPASDRDYQVLLNRLKAIDPAATKVEDWQKEYLLNLVRSEVYNVDPQVVREYFSYTNVRAGIFNLVEEMFDVSIELWETEVWDPSVESYQMYEHTVSGKKLLGQFYLDMHPREGKYKHGAAFSIREGVKGIQTPIKALVCNFPGGDGGSEILEHRQVETFLHEFGHLLHGIFGGNQPWLTMAGTNTERDFVEAPSQMLEEWVWHGDTLKTFARNSKGELIPDSLIKQMNAGRRFGEGAFDRHQMFYASISLEYYNQDPKELDLDNALKDLQNRFSPYNYVENTHFYTSFGHLEGYSATYYAYMWSLVIASDMFSEFEKYGLRNKEVAKRYRKHVLEPGGSKPAAEFVADFLGRPYSFDAFAKSLMTDESSK